MIGRLIDGRYQVRSRIARGGMATVYVATDLRLERRVAIKIMHGHLADDSSFKNRFVQEARSAARLAHPNVVNVFDQGQDFDMAYLVMEYLPGITLRDLLKDRGALTSEQTIDIAHAVLSGLAAAHNAGIVHRDLKPENVLLADDGRVKIGDFGLARAASANTATGQALLGTIAYLSPELVTRGIADARSDIYALGIMIFEILTGEQPFKGEQPMQIAYQHANESVPRPSSRLPGIPVELDDLVLWATSREPDDRPLDAQVMLDQLLEIEKHTRSPESESDFADRQTVLIAPTRQLVERETQTIGSIARHKTQPLVGGRTNAISIAALKRRTLGYWLFGLVLVLTAGAGGTGWYFGSGPGANIAIPAIIGLDPGAATTALEGSSFTVTHSPRPDLVVPAGQSSGTEPAEGTLVRKGSTITLFTSTGPKQLPVPNVVGIARVKATTELTAGGFTVLPDSPTEFSSEKSRGIVLAVLDAAESPLGATYGEQQPITLVTSAGGIPDVTGKTVNAATSTLDDVGLKLATGDEVFSDTVAEGIIVTSSNPSGVVRPGATITVTLSKGPEPVPVPSVVGMPWGQAKKILSDASFVLSYETAADLAPLLVRVTGTDPAAGQLAKKGSTITVKFL
jgi:serine/threonine protein kinase